jgi:hypothetical protein
VDPSGCANPVFAAQTIYTLTVADVTYCFHIGCYGFWLGDSSGEGLYRPK